MLTSMNPVLLHIQKLTVSTCTQVYVIEWKVLNFYHSAQWCETTNSSPEGGKVGKKMEQLGNIQNVGSRLFSVHHDLTLCSIFSSILVLFLTFSIQVKGKNYVLLKVAKFHTKNPIFKVEYLTEWQKVARIFNVFVLTAIKR